MQSMEKIYGQWTRSHSVPAQETCSLANLSEKKEQEVKREVYEFEKRSRDENIKKFAYRLSALQQIESFKSK